MSRSLTDSGFSLSVLELYNWGTFNKTVARICPHGKTSLLTGANGSGKSTIVDALLTLLVPSRRRNYNLAGASEGKRRNERSELSYVLGAYGKKRAEEDQITRTQYLRTKDGYSVVLAVFKDGVSGICVTLAQIFYFQSDTLAKVYITASGELSVADDFSEFDNFRQLKKRFRQREGVTVYDSFSDYMAGYTKALGIRSPKAIDLFNQTVAIKEIGNLNSFIRQHMLEKPDVEKRIDDLRSNFENLDKAYKAIIRARQQLEKLSPLVKEIETWENASRHIKELEALIEVCPVWFAAVKHELVEKRLTETGEQIETLRQRRSQNSSRTEESRKEEINLLHAVENDESARRLSTLEREQKDARALLQKRETEKKRYNTLAGRLDLKTSPTETVFYKSRSESKKRLEDTRLLMKELETNRDTLTIAVSRFQEKAEDIETELSSLLDRKTQIPAELIALRKEIAVKTGLREDDIPFAGELMQVKEESRNELPFIERALKPLSLSLLVSSENLKIVTQTISALEHHQKISWIELESNPLMLENKIEQSSSLCSSLEFKEKHSFCVALKEYLFNTYNFIFCKTVDTLFKQHPSYTHKAVMRRGGLLYEQDERYPLDDPRAHCIGWDNRPKINALKQELRLLTDKRLKAEDDLKKLSLRTEGLLSEREALRDVLQFDSFEVIDTAKPEEIIKNLTEQISTLEKSSNRLATLRNQLKQCRKTLEHLNAERDKLHRELVTAENKQKELIYKKEQAEEYLADKNKCADEKQEEILKEKTAGHFINIDTCDTLEKEITAVLNREQRKEHAARENLQMKIVRAMERFKGTWPEECAEMDASLDASADYIRLEDILRKDNLPRYENEFKKMLNDKVLTDVSMFHSFLVKETEKITRKIGELNRSLETINYTDDTFITLNCQNNKDLAINEFKHMLRECFENLGTIHNEEQNERGFKKIQKIIKRFDEEPHWTAKVTDVRNWLEFSASECYREGGEKNYYSDSSGKSGGQKAKLAYTILASAIAYQYGLGDDENFFSSPFSFVVIDEAFSKSDDLNSHYAMELFKQLGLKLLVVSPLDKIHVVESFIDTYHFVSNNAEENNSQVSDISVRTLKEKRLQSEN